MLFYSTASKKNSQAFLAEYWQTLCNLRKTFPSSKFAIDHCRKTLHLLPATKTEFCKKLLRQRKNYNGILLCGKTKCTLSAQIPQSKNLLLPVFEDYATENCLVQKITATTKNYNGILLCGKANCTLSAQNSLNEKLAFTVFKRLPRKNDFAR